MDIRTIIALVCMGAGVLFLVIGAVGVVKFPDFYTRFHAAGVGDTLGTLLITIGMIIITGLNVLSIKVFLVFLLLMLTNPLGTNLIIIAAIWKNNYQNYNHMKITDEGGQDANADN